MIEAYEPENAAEAHMLAHLLEQHGIKTHIHGEALQGGAGELPVSGLLRLMVADEDYARARELLLQWETKAAGAVSPAKNSLPIVTGLLIFAFGALAGWGVRTAAINSAVPIDTSVERLDLDGDGRDDLAYFYRVGAQYAYRAEGDRNFDGTTDFVEHYGALGLIVRREADDNFDGVMESRTRYASGYPAETVIDSRGDLNGVVLTYRDGVMRREELRDFRTGHVARVNYYTNLSLERSEIDLDRDGFLETVRTFDAFGEVASTETRERR